MTDAQAAGVPRRAEEVEVKRGVQLIASEVRLQPRQRLEPDLADEHPVAG